ncbi:hypothetical protein TNCV_3188261 [Trichonephila clavipes]|nr:hypothetical protein TNCV_3188261 [Trichonephila clavipes]
MSERRPLLNLPLSGNHKRLYRQWCKECWAWKTEIELHSWIASSSDLSPIKNALSMLSQRRFRDTPPATTTDKLVQYVEAA